MNGETFWQKKAREAAEERARQRAAAAGFAKSRRDAIARGEAFAERLARDEAAERHARAVEETRRELAALERAPRCHYCGRAVETSDPFFGRRTPEGKGAHIACHAQVCK